MIELQDLKGDYLNKDLGRLKVMLDESDSKKFYLKYVDQYFEFYEDKLWQEERVRMFDKLGMREVVFLEGEIVLKDITQLANNGKEVLRDEKGKEIQPQVVFNKV